MEDMEPAHLLQPGKASFGRTGAPIDLQSDLPSRSAGEMVAQNLSEWTKTDQHEAHTTKEGAHV